MLWTLYKVRSPETSVDFPEFYELLLKSGRGFGKVEFHINITHGWWDEEAREIKHEVRVLKTGTGEGFRSYAEAHKMYGQQKRHYAGNGFVHAFSVEIPSGKSIYEALAPG